MATSKKQFRSIKCCSKARWCFEMSTNKAKGKPFSKMIGLWALSTATTITKRN